ncbi:MAG: NAD(P)-binding protein [Propionibacteriales bacterium]|nr:NAD(P)-binding protein [Propionibacteriales bacterium]
MTDKADIVVAGAGHNSLITACYLAKAGYRVQVLDARPIPGGGAATEEPLLPGYLIDSCSTGHTIIQGNPLIAEDELGLLKEHGLAYIDPDPVAHVAFPDGEHLTHWLDPARTSEEIARFSRADAAAYGRMLREWDDVKEVFAGGQFRPIGDGPSLEQRLSDHPRGNVWKRRRVMSAWDVIRHEYESRHVRAYMLWQAYQTFVRPDAAGSGVLAYSTVSSRQRRSWTIPVGGSGALTEALVRCLASYGGSVLCDRTVRRLLLEGERCVGVETSDGEQYRARTAVVSSIHVTHLLGMAPREVWPDDWRFGVETYDLGASGLAVYFATTRPPEFVVNGSVRTAVSAGTVGWPEDVVRFGRDMSDGRWTDDVPWLLVATPTLADASRAPAGNHTVKLLAPHGWRLPEGETWPVLKERRMRELLMHLRRFCPGLSDDVILGSLVKGPYDFEAANPHMVRGTFHGGDRSLAYAGPQRPAPGWASHRTPIPGLYQTGGTTHPGGSITGGPGRNAAQVLLGDLGTSLREVLDA